MVLPGLVECLQSAMINGGQQFSEEADVPIEFVDKNSNQLVRMSDKASDGTEYSQDNEAL